MEHHLGNVHQFRLHLVGVCGQPAEGDHFAALAFQSGFHRQLSGQSCFFPVQGTLPGDGGPAQQSRLFRPGFIAQLAGDELGQVGRHVPEIDRPSRLEHRLHNGFSGGIVEALAGHHQAAALGADEFFHIGQKPVLLKIPLGQIDEVGAGQAAVGGQGRRRRDPAGVAAHGLQHHYMNGQAAQIGGQFRHAAGHIPGGAAESRGVVGGRQVVVHGFGNAHHSQFHTPAAAGLVDLAAGVHGAVAPVAEHPADIVFGQNMGYFFIFLRPQRGAAAAQHRARGHRQQLALAGGHGREVGQLLVQQPRGAPHGAVDPADFPVGRCFFQHAPEGCVHHSSGTAAVNHQQIVFFHSFSSLYTRSHDS